MTWEVNFDGIVGPTHNYSGLSYGNIASMQNQYTPSNPKEAALQGFKKMHFLTSLGLKQAVLPPHERPHLPSLRNLGFTGSDADIISTVAQHSPEILFGCSSAAAMWCANAATVSPSIDSSDGYVHFTAANLTSTFHRSIEPQTTAHALQLIFKDATHFKHHSPLLATSSIADEGAANHSRFCNTHQEAGIQLFVFGRYGFKSTTSSPSIFPARQTYEASTAVARLHALDKEQTVFAQQHPFAIDLGAFHNDVVAVSNENVFLFHEYAFANKEIVLSEIHKKSSKFSIDMNFIEIKEDEMTLKEAINSYLFNSQIVTLPSKKMALIAPLECQENTHARTLLEKIKDDPTNPINDIHFFNLKQSMRNGGGPACLRLRVVLNEHEMQKTHPHVFFNNTLYQRLTEWVNTHYRDRLLPKDLADPALMLESQQALDKLTQILQLGSLYSFQK